MRRIVRVLAVVSSVALAACGDGSVGGPDNGGTPAGENEIRVGNNFFAPGARTVTVGTTVTWTWNAGSVDHNVTFTGGPASMTQSSGSYQRNFPAAGVFNYLCTIHGVAMSGSITVQ